MHVGANWLGEAWSHLTLEQNDHCRPFHFIPPSLQKVKLYPLPIESQTLPTDVKAPSELMQFSFSLTFKRLSNSIKLTSFFEWACGFAESGHFVSLSKLIFVPVLHYLIYNDLLKLKKGFLNIVALLFLWTNSRFSPVMWSKLKIVTIP